MGSAVFCIFRPNAKTKIENIIFVKHTSFFVFELFDQRLKFVGNLEKNQRLNFRKCFRKYYYANTQGIYETLKIFGYGPTHTFFRGKNF